MAGPSSLVRGRNTYKKNVNGTNTASYGGYAMSLLAREQPLEALCHHLGVQSTPYDAPIPPATLTMPLIRPASRVPTHVLAVSAPEQSSSTSPPLMLPIDATLFSRGFPINLSLPSTPAPSSSDSGTSSSSITLSVVPLSVPHPSSLPLLLLFGMALERDANLLAWALLPVPVVEEFPNAAAMALVLSREDRDRFERVYRHNQGLWRNVLALGLVDSALYQLVQTAWNVTAEARRIRERAAMGNGGLR